MYKLYGQYDESKILPHKNIINRLTLSNLNLKEIPDLIYELLKLELLDISKNQISFISEKITNLTFLKVLRANDNNLTELPSYIFNIKNLVYLNLQNNKLSTIYFKKSNIKFLYLSHNNLTCIPENIDCLKKLEYLFIGNNPILRLPSNMKKMKIIKTLDHVILRYKFYKIKLARNFHNLRKND